MDDLNLPSSSINRGERLRDNNVVSSSFPLSDFFSSLEDDDEDAEGGDDSIRIRLFDPSPAPVPAAAGAPFIGLISSSRFRLWFDDGCRERSNVSANRLVLVTERPFT